jgi:non-ribosomal peptide synthetase component E (peptide arylation enzyme)
MLESGLLDATDLSGIRLVVCSGSACPPELARTVAARLRNGRFSQLWGMAEAQAGLYTRPGDPPELAAGSVGRPSPGTEVRIASADGSALPDGEEGELQVRGGLLFPGYYANPEANAQAFTHDGWFRSGDLAIQDGAGNVHITGRITGRLAEMLSDR